MDSTLSARGPDEAHAAPRDEDVAVVGAGIVGLAHAWSAARRGYRVTVFERGSTATGASVRNFGMIWPIGQPAGEPRAIANRAREAWLELAREAGIWVNACGSLHLAHREDEWAVLDEFARHAVGLGVACERLGRDAVRRISPAARPDGLIGGLYSPAELCVNPRASLAALPGWLASRYGVRFEFEATVREAVPGLVRATDGRTWRSPRTVVCGGADLRTLFPETFRASGLRRCKLQMLKTAPQPPGWAIGPLLASGLTLRHYANFAICDTLTALKARIASETPELDEFGIHVMASQNEAGEVILGDSHEYDSAIEPFDKARIDELILRELGRLIRLPDWTIAERWHGTYAKHPEMPQFEAEPVPGVHVRCGTGGAGMTMAFGLAERDWERWT
jgi:FAD dependent oxidoreductase TIGR03364